MILATLALLAAAPSAEAERLGIEVAKLGTLASLLPIVTAKEAEELVAEHPELGDSEKRDLRDTARRVANEARERLMRLTGHAYATRLSEGDMRAILAFDASPAGRAYRAAIPPAIVETVQNAGKVDYKGDVLAAFYAKTGKACPKP
ncbi:MAG TPA: DUF2059 domain-containing protein [Sphingomonas sp.]|jgi:hypothetical protein|nr:DUF2059 domain-containing protein [Sphingomonas sp.]